MPYVIFRKGEQWCVRKRGSTATLGCHPTRAQAIQQQRALYASEADRQRSGGMSATRATVPAMEGTTATSPENTSTITSTGVVQNATVNPGLVITTASETFAAGMTCPACGATNQQGAKFCSDCGSPLEPDESNAMYAWRGVLGIEGAPTADKRLLLPGEISDRELPLPFRVQLESGQGHDGSPQAGRIDTIERVPIGDFSEEGFDLGDVPENAVVIWATGVLNGEYADRAKQMIENGSGVSLDLPRDKTSIIDPETLEEVNPDEVDPFDMWTNKYIEGIGGKIAGATIVDIPAFEQAKVQVHDGVLVAAAFKIEQLDGNWFYVGPEGEDYQPAILVASAGPLKPPAEWFADPKFSQLTPLTITKDGRVYGHLADWNGCHVGMSGICVPPFRSPSNYAYFNVGEIETAEGELIPCGKLMFSMDGAGHAPTDPSLAYEQIMRYYDDATKVGAFVRAGADRFGTWLAGALRSNLSEIEIQHLRTHPPSGDWRPIRGGMSELLAAFSVPIPGFPIARGHALVASAGGEITAMISAPLFLTEEDGQRSRMRRKRMLTQRFKEALGMAERTRAEMRREAMDFKGPWLDDFANITAEQRRQWAKSGVAMPDGSFPIANCSMAEDAIRSQGRGQTAGSQAKVVAHIRTRVRALGCSGPMFDNYK